MAAITARNMYNVLVMSLAFALIFTSNNTLQSFVVALLGQLGSLQLGITYASFAVSSVFVPALMDRIGSAKYSMVLGALPYVGFCVALWSEVPALILIAASLLGACAPLLWSGNGKMITASSDSETVGRVGGAFWGIFSCNMISGNVLAFYSLPSSSDLSSTSGGGSSAAGVDSNFFGVMIGPVVLGTALLFFLRPPSVASAHHPALSDALILQKPPPPTQKMATVSASVRAMLRLLFSKQMVQLWPLSMYLAASVAMWGPIFVSTLLPSMFFLQH